MKTKLLIFIILISIITAMLCSCEIIKLANNILKFIPGNDSDNGDTNININIGGTTAHVHTEIIIPAIESTCFEHGKTEGKKCSTCGETTVPQEVAPRKEHTYDNAIDRICNVCEHVRDIDCSHNGTTEFLPAKESTCTEAGLTQGVKCTLCDEIIVAQESLPLKDHVSSDWIVDYESEIGKEGLRHTECIICGAITKQEAIPMITPSSEGLEYTLNSDGNSYSVSGIGTCTSEAVVIANIYEGKPVTAIADSAFYGCKTLTNVIIPESIKSIGTSSFANCTSLTNITIPNSVTAIGATAFINCTSLSSIDIPNSVTYIGNAALYNCNRLPYNEYDNAYYIGSQENPYFILVTTISNDITSCYIHEDTVYIGSYAFKNCTKLTSITIPNSVKQIGGSAFEGCTSIDNVIIPDGVIEICGAAFSGCTSLTNISIPNSIEIVGKYAFQNCKSLAYNEYNNVYYLGNSENQYLVLVKYKDKAITSCEIVDGTRIICDSAFYACTSLLKITIPNSVVYIGSSAFWVCSSMSRIVIPKSVKYISTYVFSGCSKLTIYCQVENIPDGWDERWNSDHRSVVWGYTGN